jgi:hypothetical protein
MSALAAAGFRCRHDRIVAVRYVAASGLFAWLTARRAPRDIRIPSGQIRREIGWSLVAGDLWRACRGHRLGLATHGWTRIYADPHAWPLWWMPASVLVYLLLHDAWFYWTHRWMHRPRVFRAIHAIHHASRPPTAWAAMNFHPGRGGNRRAVHPALVFIVPIQAGMLALVLVIMTVMGVTNHMGWEIFPRAGAGPRGALADHRQPSRPSPRPLCLQLWPLFPPLGPLVRHRCRPDPRFLKRRLMRNSPKEANFFGNPASLR